MPAVLVLGGAGGLAALTVGFEIVAGALILLMLAQLAKIWLEPLLASTSTKSGNRLLRIIDIPGRAIRGVALGAYHAVTHSVSVAATHRMAPLARWFHAAGSFAIGSAWVLREFAADAAYGVERITTVVIPREIGRAVRPVRRTAHRALTRAAAAALAVTALRRHLNRLYAHTIRPAIRHATHAVDVTLPRAIGRVGTRVRRVEREFTHPSTRWLRRIAAAMWTGTLLGLMVRALARRFPWLFCRKVKNVGGRLCGLDQGLLDALLLETILLSSVSVVQLGRELQAVESSALELLAGFIDELPTPD